MSHLRQMKREWEPAGKGTAVMVPSVAEFLFLQQRPEYVGDEALLDLRVRRALAHAIDRQALNDGLFNGLGAPTDTPVPPRVSFYPDPDRMMTKYPLDRNQASEQMGEAGFARDAEGFFTNEQGRRFRLDFLVQTSSSIERMQNILCDSWRRAGSDVHTSVIGVSQYTRQETRHTLPGLGYAYFPVVGRENLRLLRDWNGGKPLVGYQPFGLGQRRLRSALGRGELDAGSDRAWEIRCPDDGAGERIPPWICSGLFAAGLHLGCFTFRAPTSTSGFGPNARSTTNYWNI